MTISTISVLFEISKNVHVFLLTYLNLERKAESKITGTPIGPFKICNNKKALSQTT